MCVIESVVRERILSLWSGTPATGYQQWIYPACYQVKAVSLTSGTFTKVSGYSVTMKRSSVFKELDMGKSGSIIQLCNGKMHKLLHGFFFPLSLALCNPPPPQPTRLSLSLVQLMVCCAVAFLSCVQYNTRPSKYYPSLELRDLW